MFHIFVNVYVLSGHSITCPFSPRDFSFVDLQDSTVVLVSCSYKQLLLWWIPFNLVLGILSEYLRVDMHAVSNWSNFLQVV